jgi:hypothetical protein
MKLTAAVFVFAAAAASAAPCTSVADCTEWVTLADGPSRSLIYRTYATDQKNPAITRALVMVHGAGRDADNYFRTAIASAFLAGALEDTVVISPRFASSAAGCGDKLAANEVSWSCTGDSWRSGGTSGSTHRRVVALTPIARNAPRHSDNGAAVGAAGSSRKKKRN